VWRLTPVGEPLLRIVSGAGISNTNLAFGGAENRDLFITESETGSILRTNAPAPGMQMYSHA
jgi:gluconolactonase